MEPWKLRYFRKRQFWQSKWSGLIAKSQIIRFVKVIVQSFDNQFNYFLKGWKHAKNASLFLYFSTALVCIVQDFMMILDSSYRLALTSASSSGDLQNSLLVFFCKIRNENLSRPFRRNAQQVSRCCCVAGLNPTQWLLDSVWKRQPQHFYWDTSWEWRWTIVITKLEWWKTSDVHNVTAAESLFFTIVMFILKPLCVALWEF